MQDQPKPAWSDDHRATIVAALRAMAGFVEQRTDVPAPDYLHEQHSITGEYDKTTCQLVVPSNAEKIAIVRQVAERLGVEVKRSETSVYCKYQVAERAEYTVHANLVDEAPEGGAGDE